MCVLLLFRCCSRGAPLSAAEHGLGSTRPVTWRKRDDYTAPANIPERRRWCSPMTTGSGETHTRTYARRSKKSEGDDGCGKYYRHTRRKKRKELQWTLESKRKVVGWGGTSPALLLASEQEHQRLCLESLFLEYICVCDRFFSCRQRWYLYRCPTSFMHARVEEE